MSTVETLTNAFGKAVANGWKGLEEWGPIVSIAGDEGHIFVEFEDGSQDVPQTYKTIFSHDFAKALWGDGTVRLKDNPDYPGTYTNADSDNFGWRHHLQQMVIADDPIQYLSEHL